MKPVLRFSQYVSALRPPKKRHTSSTGTSIDSDMEEDVWSTNKLFQRRASLTYPKPLGTRYSFQNRSLQDFSDRIKMNMGDDLESRKRRQSVFNSPINKAEKEMTPSVSTDSVSSDTVKDEWKQVSRGVLHVLTLVCHRECFDFSHADLCTLQLLEHLCISEELLDS